MTTVPTYAERIALLRAMPITFASLVVQTTTRCTAQCAMCYQSAGPKGSPLFGKLHLSTETIKSLLSEAIHLTALYPRFHLSGGEATIHFDQCVDVIGHAKDVGFLEVSMVTNAFWANRKAHAHECTYRLRAAGLDSVEISWDPWHMPFIQAKTINTAIEACFDSAIEINLRILTSRKHSAKSSLEPLDPAQLSKVSRVTIGPMFSTGAATNLSDDKAIGDIDIQGNCHSFLNLTVTPDGEVSPCCAGFDQTSGYHIGNVNKESILEIYERMNNDLLIRQLVFLGIQSLKEILHSEGLDFPTNKGMCESCWRVFSDERIVEVLINKFREHQVLKLKAFVDKVQTVDARNTP